MDAPLNLGHINDGAAGSGRFRAGDLAKVSALATNLTEGIMAHLIAPIHRRDGMRPVSFGDISNMAYGRWLSRKLPAAHDMFVTLARRLDFMAHVLARCDLDVDALLDIASRADNPTRMRVDIDTIAERLRDQARLLDSLVWLRDVAPHYLPQDDALAWRPLKNLAWDAGCLRKLADLIARDATQSQAPPRQPCVGELVVVFRNAINGEVQRRYSEDLDEARRLAREHRPYNNTDVTIRRVVALQGDRPVTEAVSLA
ncbi:hypothetical protein [Microbispora sp. NBRC 16548]|uniref:hypothetical protein n=1 Tax=Microbispora sp. NBRC 16548 TaxID=3030994 RepID=UPI002555863D|nr:hypothetical protein [Microbispora sp. NBRC 16548]